MERCNKIYNHSLYRSAAKHINKTEKGRVFCLHDIQHSLDVARIAYILSLEENLGIEKEIIYAAALIHDIGRYMGKSHSAAGAELAVKILPECGFSADEVSEIADAVDNHRLDTAHSDLGRIIHKADRLSRKCYECSAANECYWTHERRNHKINY